MDSSTLLESQTSDINQDDEIDNGIEDSDSDEEMFSKSTRKKNKRVNNLLESDEEEKSSDYTGSQGRKSNIEDDESDNSHTRSPKMELKSSKKRIVQKLDSDSDESTPRPKKYETKSSSPEMNNSLIDKEDSSSESQNEASNCYQSSRIKEKRHKFENKFKSMLSKCNKLKNAEQNKKENVISENSDVKVKSSLPDLYDSDSENDEWGEGRKSAERSEESGMEEEKNLPKTKSMGMSKKNHILEDQPKAQRMSAKQAMEQMNKIKSESSRMLREKQVSLPYHKPKQMSLKDILAKRKANTALSNSRYGYKMNQDQLKEYAKQLENREKEILELCKSESEEEEEEEQNENSEENKESKTIESEKESKEETKNKGKDAEDFSTLQKACKNLLDIFDKNEQPALHENADEKIYDSVPANDVVTDKEEIKDVVSNDNKTNVEESNNNRQSNENSNESITKDKSKYDDVPCNINNDEINNKESDKCSDKIEYENMTDGFTNNKEETQSVVAYSTETNNVNECAESENMPPESEILFEDTDMDYDFQIDEMVAKANEEYDANKNNDKMEVDVDGNDRSDTVPKRISMTQIQDGERPSTSSQQISCSAPVANAQPKLLGAPGSFIDLISGEVQSGVELLKKKFMFHAAIKTAEELEREKERKILPGSALQKLKRDLEDKIIDNRTQEWTKRLEDLALKKKEENDNLSDCEEILEREESCKQEEEGSNKEEIGEDDESCEEEEELEENDVDLTKEKTKKKCGLLDEEAEVDDEENIVSADEEEVELNSVNCEDENDEDEVDNSSDDSGDELTTNMDVKKTLTRIIKPFEDSDSSDDEGKNEMTKITNEIDEQRMSKDINFAAENDLSDSDLKTPIKENGLKQASTSNIFESQSASKNNSFSFEWDDIPLGQKIVQTGTTPTPSSTKRLSNISLTEDKSTSGGGRSDLGSLVSPIIKLSGVPRLSTSENVYAEEFTSPSKYKSHYEDDKMNNLQKKLLFESEGNQCTQDLDELGSLCSGKFPSQQEISEQSSKPSNLDKLIGDVGNGLSQENGFTQDTENELLELCTGKFAGINETQTHGTTTLPVDDSQNITLSLSESQNTESLNKAVENILSREEVDEKSLKKDSGVDNLNSVDNTLKNNAKDSGFSSFFNSSKLDSIDTPIINEILSEDKSEITVTNRGGKFAILSSEEEDALNENGDKEKAKLLKSKKDRNKKKKFHLQFSDDESEDEECNEIEYEQSEEEGEDTERMVDYDSEENEIEVQTEIVEVNRSKKKKTSEFFDQEAELTSEDEWIGSGDEDERGMDRLEWEEGDADQLDQREVKKQLEKIHLRTILDDDKREVRMLQEILLEDDMEGGTRERKFRWSKVDTSIEPGATVGDDDVDVDNGEEDIQTEEEWRKQRHERETFLRQMEKENTIEVSQFSQGSETNNLKIVSRTSITSLITSKRSLSRDSIEAVSGNKKTMQGNEAVGRNNDDKEANEKNKKVTKDLPSPVKKPFTLLKTNVRGSFLSRGQAALNRLAMLTKNAPQPQEEGEPTNFSSLAPGKKKNFVFATVSPPCNKNEGTEEVKMAKRKATSEISTPVLIKKTKLIEQATLKSRKSLIDHID